jgi:hypothetical protein
MEYMTNEEMRDVFAALAMQGLVARGDAGNEYQIASWAYRVADAMLKERDSDF